MSAWPLVFPLATTVWQSIALEEGYEQHASAKTIGALYSYIYKHTLTPVQMAIDDINTEKEHWDCLKAKACFISGSKNCQYELKIDSVNFGGSAEKALQKRIKTH